VAHPQIAAFARLAKENSPPLRRIAGQKTLLSRTMHDIRYDALHDEFFVTNPFAQAILVFRGGANREEAPIRVIQGPKTQLAGSAYAGVDRLDVDPIHNEILVPVNNSILVFAREAEGDVAPIRVIKGPATTLGSIRTLAVDTVHNLIVGSGTMDTREKGAAAAQTQPSSPQPTGALVMFNRTDNGNVPPRAVITGSKTGIFRIEQLQVYSPKGWIVAAQAAGTGNSEEPEGVFVGVWSVNDNGDIPPRWKLAGPKSILKKPRGVALNPSNKELIVADMRLNAVVTFSFPEIF
jgi:hypothetical protein